MKWFKHDTDALTDAKVKKLIMKFGAVGYAVYFHCIELIAGDVSETNVSFELEHDAEIIADDLRIVGDAKHSGAEKVMEMMAYMIELRLFEVSENRIFCSKLLKRIDSSMLSANSKMRQLIAYAKENYEKSHDQVMTKSCYTRLDYTRLDKKRREEKREETQAEPAVAKATLHTFGSYKNIKLKDGEYEKLAKEIHNLDALIEKMSGYCQANGKKYKDYAAALRNWATREKKPVEEKSKVLHFSS
jgi:hypothetical protein